MRSPAIWRLNTVNWSLYDILIVRNENIESDELAKKITVHMLRGLGYELDAILETID
jgi:hypothetical protein